MNRRSLLSMLAVVFTMLVMAFAAPDTATAQQNLNCCTYKVDISVPAACFRVLLWTQWNVTGVIGPQVFAANGVYVFNTPTCPATLFQGASLAGPGGPWATYNNPVQFNSNGCCLVARIGYDANGCVIIYIRPC